MTNTSFKGKCMFACFNAIIVAVFSCLIAFLIVTILPKAKTHSNNYVFEAKTEDSSEAGSALEGLLQSRTELYFTGDKYYTVETILDGEPIKSDPEDYVIYDGRIYFDIKSEEFNKLSQEERNLLPSYKITADKLIMEDGEFVCESNQKMFLTGVIGLSVSAVLALIVLSMIVSYNRQMKAVSKEISEARSGLNLRQRVKALPKVARLVVMLVITTCLVVPGALIMSGAYANHSKSYVSYMFEKTFDDKGFVDNYPGTSSWGDSHKFTASGTNDPIDPDVVVTYTFKGKKLVIKTETVNNVSYEEHDYIIRDVGKDLEERFGNMVSLPGFMVYNDGYEDTRIFLDTTQEEYEEYIKELKEFPADETISGRLDGVSASINTFMFYVNNEALKEVYHVYGAYSTNYWAVHSVGIVLLIISLVCFLRLLVLIRECIEILKNKNNPATQTAGAASVQTGETTSAEAGADDGTVSEKVEESKVAEDKKLQKRQRLVFFVLLAIVVAIVLIFVL